MCLTRLTRFALTAPLLLPLAACQLEAEAGDGATGTIELAVASQALTGTRLVVIDLACTPATGAARYRRTFELQLDRTQDSVRSLFGGLPVGTCDFHAEAFESNDTTVPPTYAGSATDIPIIAGQPSSLVIVLHGQTTSDHFHASAPWISSLLVSSAAVGPGGTIDLRVVARDDEDDAAGIPLTYEWTASGGSLHGANTATPTWTAPSTAGIYSLSVRITDSSGSSAALSDIRVAAGAEYLEGGIGAGFQLQLNQGPRISRISSVQVDAADPDDRDVMVHALEVVASDPEGLSLDFAWSADAACGRFLYNAAGSAPAWTQSATGSSALFQPTAAAGCIVRVVATEVRTDGLPAATGTGTIKLRPIARPVEQEPLIVATWQSHHDTHGQQPVEFAAEIVVPYSTELPFAAWTTDGAGAIEPIVEPTWIDPAQPELGSYVEAIWTAPSCFLDPAGITLTATDALGSAWTSYTFTVGSLIETCP